MIFHTHENWQITNKLFCLFDPPGYRRYKVVELDINVPFFVLDVLQTDEPDEKEPISLWRTFFVADYDQIVQLVQNDCVLDWKVWLLLPRNSIHENYMNPIVEVMEGYTERGNCVRVFACEDKKRYRIPNFEGEESKLTGTKRVYTRTNTAS